MSKKIYDVVALGELLIDFTQNGTSAQENQLYEANPGGAPCNVLAMLTKLGKKTAFIGKVGDDQFGYTLKAALDEVGINSANLIFDKEVHTTLAFVHTFENGDRDFSFYRRPGADMMLSEEDVSEDLIKSSKIFHFGTLSLTDEKVKEATKKAITIAKENKLIITFDPNLREPLWTSLNLAKEQMLFGMEQCDILKISEEELEFITGVKDIYAAAELLKSKYSIPLILVTLGQVGSIAFYKNLKVEKPAFLQKNTIETTGAGDTFFGCTINYVLEHGLDNLSEDNLAEMLTFANAAASLITTKKGALRVMPDKQEVLNLIKCN
ncbi:carbohydrate kinase family protein [Candidatus Clostridium radicumherbarum]|uniref:Carbohydrate kinase n=1 Tax=Candidatus Clostridium radicumherbarum TaxID=3381662 RepID=A0ABW8TWI0_9CLOT